MAPESERAMELKTAVYRVKRNAELLYDLVDERNTSGFVPKADVLEGYRQIIERCTEIEQLIAEPTGAIQ